MWTRTQTQTEIFVRLSSSIVSLFAGQHPVQVGAEKQVVEGQRFHISPELLSHFTTQQTLIYETRG